MSGPLRARIRLFASPSSFDSALAIVCQWNKDASVSMHSSNIGMFMHLYVCTVLHTIVRCEWCSLFCMPVAIGFHFLHRNVPSISNNYP